MPKIKRDETRESRIENEIIVDAYGEEEQALSWYYYLGEKFKFPFLVRCTANRSTSPLKVGDEVTVIGMASDEVCKHDMYVNIEWSTRKLAIPLSQIELISKDSDTQEAIEDWHYWIAMGYEL